VTSQIHAILLWTEPGTTNFDKCVHCSTLFSVRHDLLSLVWRGWTSRAVLRETLASHLVKPADMPCNRSRHFKTSCKFHVGLAFLKIRVRRNINEDCSSAPVVCCSIFFSPVLAFIHQLLFCATCILATILCINIGPDHKLVFSNLHSP
jgi:hypothetical protein